jgi:hypothetical protein
MDSTVPRAYRISTSFGGGTGAGGEAREGEGEVAEVVDLGTRVP